MLKLGASKQWQDAMEALTGQRDVLATPLLNYFEPLRVWLEQENARSGEYIGWDIPPKVKVLIDDQEEGEKPLEGRNKGSVQHRQGLNGMKGNRP